LKSERLPAAKGQRGHYSDNGGELLHREFSAAKMTAAIRQCKLVDKPANQLLYRKNFSTTGSRVAEAQQTNRPVRPKKNRRPGTGAAVWKRRGLFVPLYQST
jgi:hypothetical protein